MASEKTKIHLFVSQLAVSSREVEFLNLGTLWEYDKYEFFVVYRIYSY